MRAIYQLTSAELTNQFIGNIKKMFSDKKIQIIISDSFDNEIDETEYLFNSETNKTNILKSIDEIKRGKGISYNLNDFIETYEKKITDANNNS